MKSIKDILQRRWGKLGLVARLGRDRRGNVLTEMALMAPVFAVLSMGTFDMGNFAMEQARLENAARTGAQLVLQEMGNIGNAAGIEAEVRNAVAVAYGPDASALAVNVNVVCACPGPLITACNVLCAAGGLPNVRLRVTAQHNVDPIFRLPGLIEPRVVTGEFTMVLAAG